MSSPSFHPYDARPPWQQQHQPQPPPWQQFPDNGSNRQRSSSLGSIQRPVFRKPVPRNTPKSPSSPPPSLRHHYSTLQPPPPLRDPQTYNSCSPDSYGSRNSSTFSLHDSSTSLPSAGSRPVSRTFTPIALTDDERSDTNSPASSRQILSKSPAEPRARRKSIFGGTTKELHPSEIGPPTWIIGHTPKVAYDVDALMAAQQMNDIWDHTGDCLVYLFKNRGPSFRVDSSVFLSSPLLLRKIFGDQTVASEVAGRRSRSANLQLTPPTAYTWQPQNSTPYSDRRRSSSQIPIAAFAESPLFPLYLNVVLDGKPPSSKVGANFLSEDAEKVVALRNLFAFLTGQSFVATVKRPSLFTVFMCLSNLLKAYEFSNSDASTFGDVAATSFDAYVQELNLADVRFSCEKTVEAVVLGERMRSALLYNEAYTHAVGRSDDIQELKSPKYSLISSTTINRMGVAAIELEKRTASIRLILTDCDFPDIHSMLMRAKTLDDRKTVNFDAWRDAFDSMRKFYLTIYKRRYGSWPPKASSRRNYLETSGLNRLVCRELYQDLSTLYDLLVDRTDLTNRSADEVLLDNGQRDRPYARAMRLVLGDYDKASPPVKPPIPFDLPKIPSMRSIKPDFGHPANKKKDAKLLTKKLRGEDAFRVISDSHNKDRGADTLFIAAFKHFERKSAQGHDIADIMDLRMGQWIFLYAVLQALPLLVVDASGVKHTEGVEYFLCAAPRSGVPWATTSESRSKMNWYGIAGGGGVVSLPTDLIENSTDGVYRRSHCWLAADRWTANDPALNTLVHEQQTTFPPTAADSATSAHNSMAAAIAPANRQNIVRRPAVRERSKSPALRRARQSVINLGLAALPLQNGVSHEDYPTNVPTRGRPRDSMRNGEHAVDTSKTFDAILANTQQNQRQKKR